MPAKKSAASAKNRSVKNRDKNAELETPEDRVGRNSGAKRVRRAGKKHSSQYGVSRSALRYKVSQRLIEISKPSVMPVSERCKRLNEITRDIPSRKVITRRARFVLARKAKECPFSLTDEELDVLVTPTGVYRTALTYKFTPWMELLSLPSYKFLKDRSDDDANRWKAYIIAESVVRGKKALEAKRKREERRKIRRQKREKDDAKGSEDEKDDVTEGGESEKLDEESGEAPKDPAEIAEAKADTAAEAAVESEEKEKPEGETRSEAPAEPDKPASTTSDVQDRRDYEERQSDGGDGEDEGAARRWAARNAWRFAPPPCKKNPFAIKRSALRGKVSPRMAELAVRTLPEYIGCKKNPFAVKRSALTGKVPGRISVLSKPNHPRDPIERPPPREKDSFGRPIYPKPTYGRKLPPRRESKPAECPDREEKDDEADGKKRKKRKIDPIAYEPTIDPCIDPERSKRQIKARKAVKEAMKKTTEAEEEKSTKREIAGGAGGREEQQDEERERWEDKTE